MSRAASTASRSPLSWEIPADEWEAFVEDVGAEWSDNTETVRIELERAMINFADADADLVTAERLLRDARNVRGLSSSTAEALTREVDTEDKKQVSYRVRDDVQDRFRAHVSEAFNDGKVARYSDINGSHTTYAEALVAALREHRDGGVGRRIRTLTEEVITGEPSSERKSIFVESDEDDTRDLSTPPADSFTPSSKVVLKIADLLPESFPVSLLTDEIQQHAGEEHDRLTEDLVDKYREAILDELPVVEHPVNNGLYITEEDREDITAWSDLDRQGRVQYFRELMIREAAGNSDRRKSVTYTETISLFDEYLGHEPSPQYAYDVMEAAASVDGFHYTNKHDEKQLRLDRKQIPDSLRADVITKHSITPIRKSAKETEPEKSGRTDTREAGSSTGNPQSEAGKTGRHDTDQWVRDATDNLPPGDVGNLPNAVIENKIARARDVDGPADLDGDGNVPQPLLDRVSEDDRQRVRDHVSADSEDNGSEAPNVETGAVDDERDVLQRATPEAMTDGGSDTGIRSE